MQAQRIVKMDKGKWLIVAGTVSNASEEQATIVVTVDVDHCTAVGLYFKRKRWRAELETVSKGFYIKAEGIVSYIDRNWMTLNDCEVIEVRRSTPMPPLDFPMPDFFRDNAANG